RTRTTSWSARSPAGGRARRVAGDTPLDGLLRPVLRGCGTTRRLSRVLWWGFSADPCPGSQYRTSRQNDAPSYAGAHISALLCSALDTDRRLRARIAGRSVVVMCGRVCHRVQLG